MKIKAVAWDMGGVLVNYQDTAFFKHLSVKSGKDEETVRAIVDPRILEMDKGQLSSNSFNELVSKSLGIKKSEVRMTKFFSEFAKPNHEVLALAEQLKRKGYEQSLISNIEMGTYLAINWMIDLNFLDFKILSPYIKMVKPEREIFEYALKKMKREGEEVVFIDDKKANVQGARSVGMYAILFENMLQLRRDLSELGVVKPPNDAS